MYYVFSELFIMFLFFLVHDLIPIKQPTESNSGGLQIFGKWINEWINKKWILSWLTEMTEEEIEWNVDSYASALILELPGFLGTSD